VLCEVIKERVEEPFLALWTPQISLEGIAGKAAVQQIL
jgi:hypothetical protein